MRVGLASSPLDDSLTAGKDAAAQAVGALGGEDPALVVVYTSARHDLRDLIAGVRSVTGDAPVVGGTTHGHFLHGQVIQPGSGVTVLALTAGPYRFGVGSATGLREDPVGTGRELARTAKAAAPSGDTPHSALLLISCGRTGDQQQLLNGIHRVLGATVPIVGGASAVDLPETETSVFCGDAVLEDSAVGVWIGADEPLRVARGHGWRAHGIPQLVTDTEGNHVRTISGRPAIDVIREVLREADAERGEPVDEEGADGVVRLGARGRCLGVIEPDGSHLLRGAFITEEGEVRTWAPLPAFSSIQIMSCDNDSLLTACREVVDQTLDGRDASVILAFGCVARCEMLGTRSGEEASRLQEAAGGVPTVGFYTYGEFARTVSPFGFHNATLTAIAL